MRGNEEKPINIAIVGCGAVTERGHLPAALTTPGVKVRALVDRNLPRAQALARAHGVENAVADVAEVIGSVDGAIVALPHHLHAPVSANLLRSGIHVLVEKPMALTTAECDQMIEASRTGNATLSVGLMRRFLWSAQFIKEALEDGLLGRVTSFDIAEGYEYNWPVASDFFFRRESAGGGVLFDTGSHTLDTVLWWFGDIAAFEYYDDNYGGVEADCLLRLKTAGGVTGVIELSRTRNLRNTVRIEGERGTLEVSLHNHQFAFQPRGRSTVLTGLVGQGNPPTKEPQALTQLLSAQMVDWRSAIREGRAPRVGGTEARRSVALMEACYASRRPLDLPWMRPTAPTMEAHQ